ncbi:MAG: regulatory iron-sulfur-containing complex subunit RicT [bacterium]|nr:regulatory iron-sulfur-containing complex subunit RicT [bacterium]
MKVVSVKLDNFSGPVYCEAGDFPVHVGNVYIINTEFGLDIGKILRLPFEEKGHKAFKNVAELVRLANQDDFRKMEELEKENMNALKVARSKVEKHNLQMKIFGARYMFDRKRLMFYFVAENRIDFRNYVKDLASVFKTRIELRQVSERDEARMIGGLGVCGMEQCCITFLKKYDNVSIKMAKDQNLSLNTVKISGNCGKLLCCLDYEYETYKELKKNFPKEGTSIRLDVKQINREKYFGYNIPSEGEIPGKVKGLNVIKETLFVEIENDHIIEVNVSAVKK